MEMPIMHFLMRVAFGFRGWYKKEYYASKNKNCYFAINRRITDHLFG